MTMHILNKVVLSKTEPERNVLWLNPRTQTLSYFDDGWKPLLGSGTADFSKLQSFYDTYGKELSELGDVIKDGKEVVCVERS